MADDTRLSKLDENQKRFTQELQELREEVQSLQSLKGDVKLLRTDMENQFQLLQYAMDKKFQLLFDNPVFSQGYNHGDEAGEVPDPSSGNKFRNYHHQQMIQTTQMGEGQFSNYWESFESIGSVLKYVTLIEKEIDEKLVGAPIDSSSEGEIVHNSPDEELKTMEEEIDVVIEVPSDNSYSVKDPTDSSSTPSATEEENDSVDCELISSFLFEEKEDLLSLEPEEKNTINELGNWIIIKGSQIGIEVGYCENLKKLSNNHNKLN
ncbi:uncharacterized protein LOC113282010 [Papaver somniferum]|uniref:uncharacterized protein LOC113282010 n=1 Tax=Papaver somniferum TaxID=3469 RepID=UPI000E6FE399|nr:uncharacterized protein LOC113282010 [Papaver somniferum]